MQINLSFVSDKVQIFVFNVEGMTVNANKLWVLTELICQMLFCQMQIEDEFPSKYIYRVSVKIRRYSVIICGVSVKQLRDSVMLLSVCAFDRISSITDRRSFVVDRIVAVDDRIFFAFDRISPIC